MRKLLHERLRELSESKDPRDCLRSINGAGCSSWACGQSLASKYANIAD